MAAKKKKKARKLILILLLVVLVAGGYMYFNLRGKTASFNTETAVVRDIETFFTFSGNIEPNKYEIVTATSEGTVKKLLLEEGATVSEDDKVLAMKDGTRIKAPREGTISDIYVDPDDNVRMGDPLFRIADYGHPKLTIKVDEYDIGALTKGQKIRVKVHATGAELTGVISRVAQEATVANDVAYYSAEIAIPQDGTLQMGLTCEVYVPRQKALGAVTVSANAVRYDANSQPYLLIPDEEGHPVPRYVTIGVNNGTIVEVREGLAEGESVVSGSSYSAMAAMMQMRGMGRGR